MERVRLPLGLLSCLVLGWALLPLVPADAGTLRGFVRGRADGEAMAYVQVTVLGTGRGDVSDEHGYFVIPGVPAGVCTVRATMVGYRPVEVTVQVPERGTVTLNFELERETIPLPAVVKTAERERFEREVLPSAVRFSPQEIRAVPAVVEPDVFRSLQLLPGVVARTDFSSALYVRGGNPSENLVLLDGVRIYNLYHVGGVFSTFNPDAVKRVDFFSGAFPSQFGNAVSSVISVVTKEGNSKRFQASGNVSLLSSELTVEGPIPRGSMLVSGRRTYFDLAARTLGLTSNGTSFPYYFYDVVGKANVDLSPDTRLTVSGYYGDDVFHFTSSSTVYDEQGRPSGTKEEWFDIRMGNRSTTLKLRTVVNPRLFVVGFLASSRFRTKIATNVEDVRDLVDAKDSIHDLTVKADATYFASDRHELKFGLEATSLRFNLYFRVGSLEWLAYQGKRSRRTTFSSAYLQDNWQVTPLLNIQGGLRVTYYSLGRFLRGDPRFALRYRLRHDLNLKFATGLFHQYFYTFNPEDLDYVRLVDLWFPVDRRYRPIRAFHVSSGVEVWLGRGFLLSLEGYYKYYPYLLDLNELGRADVQTDDFLTGRGRAAGLELFVRKREGRLQGWLAYTLAKVTKTIELPRPSSFLLNADLGREYRTYPTNYDRRHTLTLVANYDARGAWRFSTRFTYATGLPETPVVGWKFYYYVEDDEVRGEFRPVRAPKNSWRLPDYLRWDVSLSRRFRIGRVRCEPYLQIVNLTNHHNIFLYEYDLFPEQKYENGRVFYTSMKPRRKGVIMFPFLPSIGVQFRF